MRWKLSLTAKLLKLPGRKVMQEGSNAKNKLNLSIRLAYLQWSFCLSFIFNDFATRRLHWISRLQSLSFRPTTYLNCVRMHLNMKCVHGHSNFGVWFFADFLPRMVRRIACKNGDRDRFLFLIHICGRWKNSSYLSWSKSGNELKCILRRQFLNLHMVIQVTYLQTEYRQVSVPADR